MVMSWPLRIATLNKGVGVLRFTSSLPPSVSYSRTGAATAFTVAGVVVPFAANAPQLTDRGLLLEPARTNLLTRSQEIDNAAWTKANATVSADAVLAPDGTLTADRLTENTAPSVAHGIYRGATIVAGQTYSISTFGKANGRSQFLLWGEGDSSNGPAIAVDMAAASITATGVTAGAAGGAYASSSLLALADSWYRPSVTGTAKSDQTAVYCHPLLLNAPASTTPNPAQLTYTGDGTSGAYFWGAQLEVGSSPSSYIPTTTAAATRGLPTATVVVPPGKTVARATYGLSNTVVDVTGLTPGATFDLVTGRAWVGLGNELKTLEWRP